MRLTKNRINKAIAHTGLKVHGESGAGYFYFVDIKTNYTRGINVHANRLNHPRHAALCDSLRHMKTPFLESQARAAHRTQGQSHGRPQRAHRHDGQRGQRVGRHHAVRHHAP
jgi:hypothetical protein